MSKDKDDEYIKERDLETECVDLHAVNDAHYGEFVMGTPNKAMLLRERKKLAAIGRRALANFHRFLVEDLGLAEHTANQTVARLTTAVFETNNAPWKKLRVGSLSYEYKKLLHSDLRKWVLFLTDNGADPPEEGSSIAEMIHALVESRCWAGGDEYELIQGYLRRRKVKPTVTALPLTPQPAALPAVQVPGTVTVSLPTSASAPLALPASAAEQTRNGVIEPIATEPEKPSEEKEVIAPPAKKRQRFKRTSPEEASEVGERTGEEKAIAAPVKAERRLIVDGEEAVSSPVAARMIGIQPQSLRAWRLRGISPEYVRLGEGPGARVAYKVSVIERWIAEHSFRSTAEEAMNTPRKR